MVFSHNASDDWTRYGDADPYFGVLSDDRYHGRELSSEDQVRFFSSGRQHVNTLLQNLRESFGEFPRETALDFGCGVGRISQAMAPEFTRVVGLDVSEGMLREAKANAAKADIGNIEYHHSLDSEFLRPRSYDLVHSYIVLQHIPVSSGEQIIANLIEAVRVGGIGALHVTIEPATGKFRANFRNFVKRNKLLRMVANIAMGRPFDRPAMEMNLYNTSMIVELLARSGIERFSCVRIDDWGSLGIYFWFKRQPGEGSKSPWSNPVEGPQSRTH